MASLASVKRAVFDREQRKQHYQAHIRGLNALDRHHKFINDYVNFYGKHSESSSSALGTGVYNQLPVRTDKDALRDGYRFIRTQQDDIDTSWEQRLVKRYYDKLFKEYCIADMSKYKTGKIGLRWRTDKEVISGKGQFICGNKHCHQREALASFEVKFSYLEAGESKQALVKLVACQSCAEKLNYRRNKEKEQSESRQRDDNQRNRQVAEVDDDNDKHGKSSDSKRKKSEEVENGGREDAKRLRSRRSSRDESTDEESESSKEQKKKGLKGSASRDDDEDGGENFDEFLEGMFP